MAFRANASRLQSQRLASMIAGVLQRMASPSTRFAAMHGPGPADGSGLAPPRDFTLPRDFMLPRALVSCIDRHSRMLPHGFMSPRDPMFPRLCRTVTLCCPSSEDIRSTRTHPRTWHI